METLKDLIKERKEIGQRQYTNGGNYNDFLEYAKLGELIIEEVCRMYDAGELN